VFDETSFNQTMIQSKVSTSFKMFNGGLITMQFDIMYAFAKGHDCGCCN